MEIINYQDYRYIFRSKSVASLLRTIDAGSLHFNHAGGMRYENSMAGLQAEADLDRRTIKKWLRRLSRANVIKWRSPARWGGMHFLELREPECWDFKVLLSWFNSEVLTRMAYRYQRDAIARVIDRPRPLRSPLRWLCCLGLSFSLVAPKAIATTIIPQGIAGQSDKMLNSKMSLSSGKTPVYINDFINTKYQNIFNPFWQEGDRDSGYYSGGVEVEIALGSGAKTSVEWIDLNPKKEPETLKAPGISCKDHFYSCSSGILPLDTLDGIQGAAAAENPIKKNKSDKETLKARRTKAKKARKAETAQAKRDRLETAQYPWRDEFLRIDSGFIDFCLTIKYPPWWNSNPAYRPRKLTRQLVMTHIANLEGLDGFSNIERDWVTYLVFERYGHLDAQAQLRYASQEAKLRVEVLGAADAPLPRKPDRHTLLSTAPPPFDLERPEEEAVIPDDPSPTEDNPMIDNDDPRVLHGIPMGYIPPPPDPEGNIRDPRLLDGFIPEKPDPKTKPEGPSDELTQMETIAQAKPLILNARIEGLFKTYGPIIQTAIDQANDPEKDEIDAEIRDLLVQLEDKADELLADIKQVIAVANRALSQSGSSHSLRLDIPTDREGLGRYRYSTVVFV